MVDAVESPRFLPAINEPLAALQPALPTPLEDVVVADESLRENIEWPNDDNLSFDSINDFSCSSLQSGGGERRRLHRIDRINANIKKNVAIIAQTPHLIQIILCSISFYFSLHFFFAVQTLFDFQQNKIMKICIFEIIMSNESFDATYKV